MGLQWTMTGSDSQLPRRPPVGTPRRVLRWRPVDCEAGPAPVHQWQPDLVAGGHWCGQCGQARPPASVADRDVNLLAAREAQAERVRLMDSV